MVLGDEVARRLGGTQRLAALTDRRVPGVRRAREALSWIRVGSKSAMETRSRVLFVRAGLPEPELNGDIHDRDGGWLATGDLLWREAEVVGEYLGAYHFRDYAQGDSDIVRRRDVERAGWSHVDFTKDDYYRLLREVTSDGNWEEWILYLLTGVERTSAATVAKIGATRELQADFARRARAASKGGADAEFLAVLFEQPYCRIATVIDRCGVSRPTATRWLSELAVAGLLDDHKVGRDRLFINREFLTLLLSDQGEGDQ